MNKSERSYRLYKTDPLKICDEVLLKKIIESKLDVIKHNELSENSSKFQSYTILYNGNVVDLMIASGSNKGQTFEKQVIQNLQNHLDGVYDEKYALLLDKLHYQNNDCKNIIKVEPRTGSTKKTAVPVDQLGSIIGDIVLHNESKWFLSLKDKNGDTISSLPGGATLFNQGNLDFNSSCATLLNTFGADLNLVQYQYDLRNDIKTSRTNQTTTSTIDIEQLFQRVWGYNYFYVRNKVSDWDVRWVCSNTLKNYTTNIKTTSINYPNESSKQIAIFCQNEFIKYKIEVRNSKGGEYPNDIKVRLL